MSEKSIYFQTLPSFLFCLSENLKIDTVFHVLSIRI